jgi:hypothetical protein
MFTKLKLLFTGILILMIGVSIWASLDKNVWDGFLIVWNEPWGVATLADAYCGFLTFFAWVCYKENSALARFGWFVLIMVFGNIAMSSYMLLALRNAQSVEDLLIKRRV